MEVLKTVDKGLGTAKGRDESGLIVRNVEGVEPGTTFVSLMTIGVEVARSEVVKERADRGILVAKSTIEVAGHEEALEAAINEIVRVVAAREVEKGPPFGVVHVHPVARAAEILLCIGFFAHIASHLSDTEIVVAVLDGARNRTSKQTNANRVKVISRDISKILPALKATTTANSPDGGLFWGDISSSSDLLSINSPSASEITASYARSQSMPSCKPLT